MYGRTVNAATYMDRVANHSTKGSRRGFVDVDTGVNAASVLTLAQKRDSLVRKHASLGQLRKWIKAEKIGKEEYERVGKEMQEIQNQLKELNSTMPMTRGSFAEVFMDCARSMLMTAEFDRISEAARRKRLEQP